MGAGLAESLAPQLSNFNISLSLVEPGPVSTPFSENIPKNHSEAPAEEKPDAYTWVLEWPQHIAYSGSPCAWYHVRIDFSMLQT